MSKSAAGTGKSSHVKECLLVEIVERDARGLLYGREAQPAYGGQEGARAPVSDAEPMSVRRINTVRLYNTLEHLEAMCEQAGVSPDTFRRLFKSRTIGGHVYLVANGIDSEINFKGMTPQRAARIAKQEGVQYACREVRGVQVHFLYRYGEGVTLKEDVEESPDLKTHQDRQVALVERGRNFQTFPEFLNFLGGE
jgi:hypothetical protein